jgi:hypothetical protein
MNTLKERFGYAVQHFAVSHLLLLCLMLAIRMFEFVTIGLSQLFPDHTASVLFSGILFDIWFWALMVVCLFPFYVLSYLVLGSFTRFFLALLFLVYLLVYISLIQYFVIMEVPLGADFWGYSLLDIQTAVSKSSSVSWASVVPYVVIIVLLFLFYNKAQEVVLAKWKLVVFYVFVFCFSMAYIITPPSASWFSSEPSYVISINKLAFFAEKSYGLFCK